MYALYIWLIGQRITATDKFNDHLTSYKTVRPVVDQLRNKTCFVKCEDSSEVIADLRSENAE